MKTTFFLTTFATFAALSFAIPNPEADQAPADTANIHARAVGGVSGGAYGGAPARSSGGYGSAPATGPAAAGDPVNYRSGAGARNTPARWSECDRYSCDDDDDCAAVNCGSCQQVGRSSWRCS
ncbi:hypothetical protein B9Z65_2320 [Elsinoe australis]|uniref:Uncharacterized protein n=1 Tax=Elsinoe australis TaxID=40998 RepID=A0A2P7ZAE2_9PEZI|nr:hypothetical protein B9Z65_2320 [Elsinoe australis]